MESIQFQNIKIIDANSQWNGRQVDVRVEKGMIVDIVAFAPEANAKSELPTAIGGCLSPGWVDMRCQLSDPGFEWREDLQSLSAAALAGGFTRILVQPNSNPVIDNAGQLQALLHRASTLPMYLHATGALSQGAKGIDLAEIFDMHQVGALAFTDGRKGTDSAGLLFRGLQYMIPFDGLVIDSPIDQMLAEEGMVADGISAVRMGLKGIPSVAEEVAVDRDIRLLAHYHGRLHIGPITTKEALKRVVEAKKAGGKFTVETSALYMLLDATENERFDGVTKIYPPLRDIESVLALREALSNGIVDVVSSGHHPQGREEKTHDFVDASFGADVLETAFAAINTGMKGFPNAISAIIAALSQNPRSILILPTHSLEIGAEAELTHFDPDAAWTPHLHDIRSKSKYNPLIGRDLQGIVLGTYVKGQYRSRIS